jgi:ribosomal-protein-alanine N-acetyltransferase
MNTEYQTDRLVLKIVNTGHLREVYEFQNRNRALFERYEPLRPENFYTLSYQQALIKCDFKLAMNLSTIRFYVFLKGHPHTIIGTVCLHNVVRGAYSCCEIGYKFDSAYHHQGYACEAVVQALEIAFFELNLHRVFARVAPDNAPSIRLLRSLGFTEEGLERKSIQIRGEWMDHLRFALINPAQDEDAH